MIFKDICMYGNYSEIIKNLDGENYANTTMKKGDVVSRSIDEKNIIIIEKIQDSTNKVPYGIIIHDVIETDIQYINYYFVGCKASVLTEGVISHWIEPSLELPVFQPIKNLIFNMEKTRPKSWLYNFIS